MYIHVVFPPWSRYVLILLKGSFTSFSVPPNYFYLIPSTYWKWLTRLASTNCSISLLNTLVISIVMHSFLGFFVSLDNLTISLKQILSITLSFGFLVMTSILIKSSFVIPPSPGAATFKAFLLCFIFNKM